MWKWLTLSILFLVLAAGVSLASSPAVTDIRLGLHGKSMRLVIEADSRFDATTFALKSPYRVVIDLPEVRWQVDESQGGRKVGFVSGFRFGHFAPGQSRVVFDLDRPAVISKNFAIPGADGKGWRYVIDLAPGTADEFAERLRRPRPEPGSGGAQAAVLIRPPDADKRPRLAQRVIVIDPGHGGIDPGAIGRGRGVYEKTITLAMAKALKESLESRGRYRVVLTRDRDVFIRLRNRVAMARAADGDLFISLHADSIGSSNVRGASVYTLSEQASDKEAAALAAKENRADLIAGIDLTHESDEVTNILIDLARRETMNQSAVFARLLIDEMSKVTSFLRRSHRFAGFAVLKAPDVPSVLVEMGYLSNPQDEARLMQPRYRARLAEGIADAVDNYFAARTAAERR